MTRAGHAALDLRDRPSIGRAAASTIADRLRPPASRDPGAGLDLGRLSGLSVRLAQSDDEIRRAQALRYRVFYQDGPAVADAAVRALRSDVDRFDAYCDHLVVVDECETAPGAAAIVGTYRLLRQDVAERRGGFYTAGEFDILPLIARNPGLRFLELGRSCVAPAYRSKRTVELLWQGIWAYARAHRIDVMIGCASLPGTDLARLAEPLSFLRSTAAAPAEWSAAAISTEAAGMHGLAPEQVDPRRAMRALPPLLRAYLRLGAYVGEGASIDRQFGTTDVLVILPVARIRERYLRHYGDDAGRFLS